MSSINVMQLMPLVKPRIKIIEALPLKPKPKREYIRKSKKTEVAAAKPYAKPKPKPATATTPTTTPTPIVTFNLVDDDDDEMPTEVPLMDAPTEEQQQEDQERIEKLLFGVTLEVFLPPRIDNKEILPNQARMRVEALYMLQMQNDRPDMNLVIGSIARSLKVWSVELTTDSSSLLGEETFTALLKFDALYPNVPPKVRVRAPVPPHPLIYSNGDVTLPMFQNWQPYLNAYEVCNNILFWLNNARNTTRPYDDYIYCHKKIHGQAYSSALKF